MFDIVFVKGIVVGQAIRELDIDGRIASLHQFQVYQQSPGAAITIDEGMDSLKFDMERRILVKLLYEKRNELIREGRYTDAIDELILKIIDAKGC